MSTYTYLKYYQNRVGYLRNNNKDSRHTKSNHVLKSKSGNVDLDSKNVYDPTTPIVNNDIRNKSTRCFKNKLQSEDISEHVENFEERVQRVGILNNSTVRAEEIWAREKCLRGP